MKQMNRMEQLLNKSGVITEGGQELPLANRSPNITFVCPMWSEVPTSMLHNSKKIWENLLTSSSSGLVIHILVVGIGKVTSALSLSHYLGNYQPDHLYVLGTCGSLSDEYPIGSVVSPSLVEDIDFFCGDLAKAPKFQHLYDRFKDVNIVVFGCTDSFKTNNFGVNAIAVDMETHSLCVVAKMYDSELRVYRVVSDMVGSNKPPMDDSLPSSVVGAINKLARNIVLSHA